MNLRVSSRRIASTLLLAGCASLSVLASGASASTGYTVQSVSAWKQNAAPVGWSSSLNRVVYNSFGSNGLFNAYSANPDGSDPTCLTCTLPNFSGVGTGTNRGASDVSPNGQYMLATVEESVHAGAIGASWTQPGSGGGNNVWLYSTDGQHAWQLTNIASAGPTQAYGTIWPRFDRTGNEIVWASMYAPAVGNLGYWTLKVANIVWTNGVPSLGDVRTIEPATDTFYEPYGFTPNDQGIIFASNYQQPSIMDDQIDTINIDGTGFTQLTAANPSTVVNYNEFAWYTPTNQIIYGSTRDATSGGMDYWTMNSDGSDPQRLTYFNEPWDTESLGYSIVEGLAFNPKNPNQFISTVSSNISSTDVNAEVVNMAPSTNDGLTEQFYSGTNFNTLLSTATQTQNPSAGFYSDSSPALTVPTTDYSIKWTGSVIPPTTGTYTYCVVADANAELYLNGTEVINGWYSYGKLMCTTASETRGTAVSIEIDYQQGFGPAYLQLSWILPGASTATIIPSTALSTTTSGATAAAAAPTATSTTTTATTPTTAPTATSAPTATTAPTTTSAPTTTTTTAKTATTATTATTAKAATTATTAKTAQKSATTKKKPAKTKKKPVRKKASRHHRHAARRARRQHA